MATTGKGQVLFLVNAAFWFLFYRVYPRDVALQEQRSRQVDAAAR